MSHFPHERPALHDVSTEERRRMPPSADDRHRGMHRDVASASSPSARLALAPVQPLAPVLAVAVSPSMMAAASPTTEPRVVTELPSRWLRQPMMTNTSASRSDEDDEKTRKRLKHREYVRRSYQKKIRTIEQLRAELNELERQFDALLQGSAPGDCSTDIQSLVPTRQTAHGDAPTLLRPYIQLRNERAALQRENEDLYARNAEFMKAESRVQQLVDAEQHELLAETRPKFEFRSLGPNEYASIIADVRDDVLRFAAASPTKKVSTGAKVFGWTDERQVKGDAFKFALNKQFPNISAHELLGRTWAVFASPSRFSAIYPTALRTRFYLLEHVNDDTILYYRTVEVYGDGRPSSNRVAKTVFLLARIKIDDGYLVVFRAVDKDRIGFRELPHEHNGAGTADSACSSCRERQNEMWVDKYSWLIIRDQPSDPNGCMFHFGGETLSLLWLKELLFIALRWEMLVIGPPFALEQGC
ncbi:hypothetical protein PINS_up006028 [Pythium insidiosum]|nr:hypothetical protein PINS_up006028 [Pythium insidiosum]